VAAVVDGDFGINGVALTHLGGLRETVGGHAKGMGDGGEGAVPLAESVINDQSIDADGVSLEVVTIVDGDYGVGFPIVMLLPCCFERVHLSLKMG
jgi:hypothetical protein